MVSVLVNGEPHACGAATSSVADLLAELGYTGKRIAIERNGEIVPRGSYPTTFLASGDRFEIVIAVGGG